MSKAPLHEAGDFYVITEQFKGRTVYKVFKNCGTHAQCRSTFDLGNAGLARAIKDCNARHAGSTPPWGRDD